MIRLYIDNKVIVFTSRASEEPGAARLQAVSGERMTLTKLFQKVQFTKRLEVISPEWESLFADFCSSLRVIEAGGGLVTEPSGSILMILRNGRWDLPKGKRESDEAIETCALREVHEECGLTGLISRGHLTDTWHGYRIGDEWVLKRTVWFRMLCPAKQPPTPQTEEGIARAEWIDPENLSSKLNFTYDTIRDVFEEAGY